MKLEDVKKNTKDGLILAGGVAAAVVVIKAIKGKAAPWLEPLVALVPGLAMKIAGKEPWVQSLGSGFIAVGLLDGANKLTTKVPVVNAYIPKINGLGQPAYDASTQGVMGFRGTFSEYTPEEQALMGFGEIPDTLRLVS